MITVVEISKDTKVKKAICPHCKKPLYNVGLMEGSKAQGVTTVCKFCGRVYEIKTT